MRVDLPESPTVGRQLLGIYFVVDDDPNAWRIKVQLFVVVSDVGDITFLDLFDRNEIWTHSLLVKGTWAIHEDESG